MLSYGFIFIITKWNWMTFHMLIEYLWFFFLQNAYLDYFLSSFPDTDFVFTVY